MDKTIANMHRERRTNMRKETKNTSNEQLPLRHLSRLPDSELEVMLVLWHTGTPMTIGEITKVLENTHQWKNATVHVLLERLGERDFVTCDKSGYKHLYTAVISEEEYRAGEQNTLIRRFFGGSAKNMIASLLWNDNLTEEDLTELEEMVKKRKGEEGWKDSF